MKSTLGRAVVRGIVALGILGSLLVAGAAPSGSHNSVPVAPVVVDLLGQ